GHVGVWYRESSYQLDMVVWLYYLIQVILITPNLYVSGIAMPMVEKKTYSSIFLRQKIGTGFWNPAVPICLTIDWLCLMANKMRHISKKNGSILQNKKKKASKKGAFFCFIMGLWS